MARRKRLPTQKLHEIVCMILENALHGDKGYSTDAEGYITIQEIHAHLLNEQDKLVGDGNGLYYEDCYNISELIKKGINPWLEPLGKAIYSKKAGRTFVYKGYDGVLEDYKSSREMHSSKPIEEGMFEFVKGTVTFQTMAAIRNRIRSIEQEADRKSRTAKFSPRSLMLLKNLACGGAFLCFEESEYEFCEDYQERIAREQTLLLTLTDAIIRQQVVKVSYQPFHFPRAKELEFHPHYIRRVGKKLMVYGFCKDKDSEADYVLTNLIIRRILSIESLSETVPFRSAQRFGIDYNHNFFRHTMTFNANIRNNDRFSPVKVILKIRKSYRTQPDGRMVYPFERILSEPLHHSQKICEDYPSDKNYGYISLNVSDYLYIKPILLSWGSYIEVVSPQDLREKMAEEVKLMVRNYLTEESKQQHKGLTLSSETTSRGNS